MLAAAGRNLAFGAGKQQNRNRRQRPAACMGAASEGMRRQVLHA
jgi:hypothetical protein